MGHKYVPEAWRKKFSVDQTVWYLDHTRFEITKGKFVKYIPPYGREYGDMVMLEGKSYGIKMNCRIIESWTFDNRAAAYKCLKSYIEDNIKTDRSKLNRLESKLKALK